jgi:ribosomal protein S18 acetylase RimI-like enzyme
MTIRTATTDDIPAIVKLLNSAYRGVSSRAGWTTEADLIGGEVRTSETDVQMVMTRQGSRFLLLCDETGGIKGCVNLQLQAAAVYLGMFAVQPGIQGQGLGRMLLTASENWTLESGRERIVMWVISVRTELIAWYQRLGFRDTGERKEFKEDGLSGPHLRPLEFMILEKAIAAVR